MVVRVAEDDALDAPLQHHLRAFGLVGRIVEGVGDERRVAVLGGGLLHPFVDGGEHEVLKPGDQHAHQPGPGRAQAGGVGVGTVLA